MTLAGVGGPKRWMKESALYQVAKPLVRWWWRARGRPIPPPHAVKEAVLREYARRFGTRVLVETGTFLGDMPAELRGAFEAIYTIELSEELHARAVKRFRPWSHIHPLQGDSADVLPSVLAQLSQPALFWLDGHHSGGITARGLLSTPIVREVELIFAHPVRNHVLVIDDARCFNGTDDYPKLDDFLEWVASQRPEYTTEVRGDSIRLTPPPATIEMRSS